jgi:hypothetical protein
MRRHLGPEIQNCSSEFNRKLTTKIQMAITASIDRTIQQYIIHTTYLVIYESSTVLITMLSPTSIKGGAYNWQKHDGSEKYFKVAGLHQISWFLIFAIDNYV